MIFESSKMRLEVISTKSLTDANDCYICKDLNSPGESLYTVIVLKDHELIRNVLEAFRKMGDYNSEMLVDSFAYMGRHIIVFPYRRERNLFDFYAGDSYKLSQCEEICSNTIISCMTSGLPYPLLYLILVQKELNLSADNTIYLGFAMDMADFDPEITEKECVVECAKILMFLLEPKASQKVNSYVLLQKKSSNRSYSKFAELYRDITIAAVGQKKQGLISRFKAWFSLYSNTIFGILFWVCVILGIFALSILLSRLLLGNGSWIRLLFNNFKRIGTESLLQ
ncbi:MAG: hypothetical protein K6B41_07915 [Butyrivibrio sp.]|nr:hypothetical protein [Butyrivibrio sp.]